MNIAEEFSIGNTKIKICTDFCESKTKADVEKILRKIEETALPYLQNIGTNPERVNLEGA